MILATMMTGIFAGCCFYWAVRHRLNWQKEKEYAVSLLDRIQRQALQHNKEVAGLKYEKQQLEEKWSRRVADAKKVIERQEKDIEAINEGRSALVKENLALKDKIKHIHAALEEHV